jgi:hypothetical protein
MTKRFIGDSVEDENLQAKVRSTRRVPDQVPAHAIEDGNHQTIFAPSWICLDAVEV